MKPKQFEFDNFVNLEEEIQFLRWTNYTDYWEELKTLIRTYVINIVLVDLMKFAMMEIFLISVLIVS